MKIERKSFITPAARRIPKESPPPCRKAGQGGLVRRRHRLSGAVFIFGTGAILLLLVGFAFGWVAKGSKISPPTPSPTPQLTSFLPSPRETSTTSFPDSGTFKVTRVIDGDTVEIEGGERVHKTPSRVS